MDKGDHNKDNLQLILSDMIQSLTAKILNKSDDKRINAFDKSKATLIEDDRRSRASCGHFEPE